MSAVNTAPQCTEKCSSTTPTQRNMNDASITLTSEVRPSSTILLSTAQVFASHRANKNKQIVRCLIDNGSQNHLITLDCCNKLNLPVNKLHDSYLQGVGKSSRPVHGFTYFDIESRTDPNNKYHIYALVIDCITDRLPANYVDITEDMTYLNNLPLADLSWNIPSEIDVVLGVQLFPYIYLGNKVESGSRAPTAILTSFGYVLMGDVPAHSSQLPTHSTAFFTALPHTEIESSLHKFFELEEVPSKSFLSPDEAECENIFTSSVIYQDKHFSVDLPFCKDPSVLGDSRSVAYRRFQMLERKFDKVDGLRQNYNKTINEYIQQGYLSEAPEADSDEGYYIPHHAVFKAGKDSARAVLDASCKTQSGLSLNDILYVGPNLQSDLFLLLIDFRIFPVAVTADVKQMFLRVSVNEHHRKYLKILFRFDPQEPIRTYQFSSLPFGLKPSPYIAMRTIRKLAHDHSDRFPDAAKVVNTQFFMDDFVYSLPDVPTAINLSRDLIDLFKLGSFDLIKWSSNSPALLEALPDSHRSPVSFSDTGNNNFKILGLSWEPADDNFSFTTVAVDSKCTKRSILSLVARLFDVLGLVAPVVLFAKILVKELWLSKIDWDEVPPESIQNRFAAFLLDLPTLSTMSIPRHIGVNLDCAVNIVAFCDASLNGYGSCIYLHITDPAGNIVVRLLCAKSKVSPSKIQTLARLELVAALLLSKLVRVVQERISERIPIVGIYAFSDSTIALSWIHSSPHRWSIFVSNRVAKIQENLPPHCFHHVSGKENPSDCISRGMLPSQLISHSLWWDGPVWLQRPVNEWPIDIFTPLESETLPEFKDKSNTLIVAAPSEPSLIDEISNHEDCLNQTFPMKPNILRFYPNVTASLNFLSIIIIPLIVILDLDCSCLFFVNAIGY
ncbi:uncharacterized protein LOC135078291 [Ostrinia nubilalis]|uniref:uncharacterized protein LOC135078291 n=1 Tax=Ostrinia nubilalis TaxID=29057 RepID=UPI0030822DD4